MTDSSAATGMDALTEDQADALIALYGACATPDHYYWMPLYKLTDNAPYLDGRVLTSLVRRGFVQRRDPEPPARYPTYKLTEKGVERREAMLHGR